MLRSQTVETKSQSQNHKKYTLLPTFFDRHHLARYRETRPQKKREKILISLQRPSMALYCANCTFSTLFSALDVGLIARVSVPLDRRVGVDLGLAPLLLLVVLILLVLELGGEIVDELDDLLEAGLATAERHLERNLSLERLAHGGLLCDLELQEAAGASWERL